MDGSRFVPFVWVSLLTDLPLGHRTIGNLSAGSAAEKSEWLYALKFAVDDALAAKKKQARDSSHLWGPLSTGPGPYSPTSALLPPHGPADEPSVSFAVLQERGGVPAPRSAATRYSAFDAKRKRDALTSILPRSVAGHLPPPRPAPKAVALAPVIEPPVVSGSQASPMPPLYPSLSQSGGVGLVQSSTSFGDGLNSTRRPVTPHGIDEESRVSGGANRGAADTNDDATASLCGDEEDFDAAGTAKDSPHSPHFRVRLGRLARQRRDGLAANGPTMRACVVTAQLGVTVGGMAGGGVTTRHQRNRSMTQLMPSALASGTNATRATSHPATPQEFQAGAKSTSSTPTPQPKSPAPGTSHSRVASALAAGAATGVESGQFSGLDLLADSPAAVGVSQGSTVPSPSASALQSAVSHQTSGAFEELSANTSAVVHPIGARNSPPPGPASRHVDPTATVFDAIQAAQRDYAI
jgi:hypothetical protein